MDEDDMVYNRGCNGFNNSMSDPKSISIDLYSAKYPTMSHVYSPLHPANCRIIL